MCLVTSCSGEIAAVTAPAKAMYSASRSRATRVGVPN
jgi:hypothetical protein